MARYGVAGGVALTSLLFCLMHLHPVHVVALVPFAVYVHLSYLAAGSLWVPAALHFLNNAAGVLMMAVMTARGVEIPDPLAGDPLAGDAVPPGMFLLAPAAAAAAAVGGWAVWRSRPRWVDAAGVERPPRWPTVERPAAGLRPVTRPHAPSLAAFLLVTAPASVLAVAGTVAALLAARPA